MFLIDVAHKAGRPPGHSLPFDQAEATLEPRLPAGCHRQEGHLPFEATQRANVLVWMTACRADSAGELGAFWLIVVVCYCKWLDSLSDARNAFSEQCELVGRFVAGLPDSDR